MKKGARMRPISINNIFLWLIWWIWIWCWWHWIWIWFWIKIRFLLFFTVWQILRCRSCIGWFGRFGSSDPWLGIPVTWPQISGARAIIESSLPDITVEPSQGSHFFQNINSFLVGYFTIKEKMDSSFVEWNWLQQQKPAEQKQFIKHLKFETPVIIKMNGHSNKGIILKPEKISWALIKSPPTVRIVAENFPPGSRCCSQSIVPWCVVGAGIEFF